MDNRLKFLYHLFRLYDGGTQEGRECARLDSARPSSEAGRIGKSVLRKAEAVMARENYSTEVLDLTLPRKASRRRMVPVPQTDTGRRGENPQVLGKTLVKELGKMTP